MEILATVHHEKTKRFESTIIVFKSYANSLPHNSDTLQWTVVDCAENHCNYV